MRRLSPCSLVVNGTGLGKDAPGSPITDAAVFPRNGIAWDFNYRGDLAFLRQARAQAPSRRLRVEDGWLCVIGDVFHRDISPRGSELDELCRLADEERKRS
jgi:shikimate 5-dehydrogenase